MAMICVNGARECTGCMACVDDPDYLDPYGYNQTGHLDDDDWEYCCGWDLEDE